MYAVKSVAGLLALFLGGAQLCAAAPAPAPQDSNVILPVVTDDIPIATLPIATFPVGTLTLPGGGGPVCTAKCYTHTTTKTVTKKTCAAPTNVMCPLYIMMTTKNVPCANPECCPRTPTVTKTKTICPTGCVIPTSTVLYTTGCLPVLTLAPQPTVVVPTVIPTGTLTRIQI